MTRFWLPLLSQRPREPLPCGPTLAFWQKLHGEHGITTWRATDNAGCGGGIPMVQMTVGETNHYAIAGAGSWH